MAANRLTGGIDEFFSRTDSAGTTFPLTDALGSTIALTDTSGTVQTQYTYDPFGGVTAAGAMSTNAYQYTGRVSDGTGLYYYRARYYSPRFQRFISEDPLKFHGGGPNLYSYALDSPVIYSDPMGLHVHCDYCQNTGGLTCVDTDTSKKLLDTKGYSGGNEGQEPWCVNNPFCEPFGDTGPIPQGTYYIGPAYKSPKLGPETFNLTPTDDTDTFDRDRLRMHGPNHAKDFDSPGWPPFGQRSSQGCIVAPSWARDKLAQNRENGDTLDVTNCE